MTAIPLRFLRILLLLSVLQVLAGVMKVWACGFVPLRREKREAVALADRHLRLRRLAGCTEGWQATAGRIAETRARLLAASSVLERRRLRLCLNYWGSWADAKVRSLQFSYFFRVLLSRRFLSLSPFFNPPLP